MAQTIKLEKQVWRIERKLAEGGFAEVYLASSADRAPVVVKLIPRDTGADRELQFHEDLSGIPNAVPILDKGEWGRYWVIVMPRADKSLRDFFEEITERPSFDESLRVLADVTESLAAMGDNIVHRDIKPDNILFLEGRWCLADFGIARYAEATTASDTLKFAKTPCYAAPEQWRGERATNATDVYATGVVAYELLAGRPPFLGPEPHDYRRQHLEELPPAISNVPIKLESLINECLNKSPDSRPHPENILMRIAQLDDGAQPPSQAAARLQQADALTVQKRSEAARQRSIAKSEQERRYAMYEAALDSLDQVLRQLDQQITVNAPTSRRDGPLPKWAWSLGSAELSVEPSIMKGQPDGAGDSPLDVMGYSSIDLRLLRVNDGYAGRSHSLWFCDAQEMGEFRWFETAFVDNPFANNRPGIYPSVQSIAARNQVEPFSMGPDQNAYAALSPVGGLSYQVAWPFTPIDKGDEEEFIERWMDWFAEAALGELRRPSARPERDPAGTWRQQDLGFSRFMIAPDGTLFKDRP